VVAIDTAPLGEALVVIRRRKIAGIATVIVLIVLPTMVIAMVGGIMAMVICMDVNVAVMVVPPGKLIVIKDTLRCSDGKKTH
jgi:hypothetical protein